jgi:hypothetical protein
MVAQTEKPEESPVTPQPQTRKPKEIPVTTTPNPTVDPTAVLLDLQDTFFANVKKSQDAVLSVTGELGGLFRSAISAVPTLPALPEMPKFLDQLPKPEAAVATGFAFAEKLLASQREFSEKLLAAAK